MRHLLVAAALAATVAAPASANLLVNGGFEASSSPTATPPGWFNIGHSDGIIQYSQFGPTPYEGLNFYDIGGFGDASGPAGDGIAQTVATSIGTSYTLTFGYSSENSSGQTFLDVMIGSQLTQIDLLLNGLGAFQKPFTTLSINYLATSAFTTISFVNSPDSASFGANDGMIDGVIFDVAGGTVPEPASWALMIGGFGLVGGAMRRHAARTATV